MREGEPFGVHLDTPNSSNAKQEQYETQVEENARACGAGKNHDGDRRTVL